ncbi:MAG: class I SAM-dependent methyltransferase [Cyclobacteriaceae bacterium]|nr:class I SAM-dependent methyltransferase [Cyclobacteriaceae bacterium]
METVNLIKKFIPDRIKGSINVLLGRAKAIPIEKVISSQNLKLHCPVCDQKINSFKRMPDLYMKKLDEVAYIHPVYQIETLNIMAYSCPVCRATDRERLYATFLLKNSEIVNKSIKILDIAPSKSLQRFLKNRFITIDYRSADLMSDDVDDKIDITDMGIYQECSFDFIICSHVLEHVIDDLRAMKELYRILKPGGMGIVMAPILLSLKEDYENPEIKSEDERWKHFAQGDHVRMYSKSGFINKLKVAGFKVNQYNIDTFGSEVFMKHGIHQRSVLYVVEK